MPLATVYPLVSTRSLARPFTYEVPEGVAKGAVVSVRLMAPPVVSYSCNSARAEL